MSFIDEIKQLKEAADQATPGPWYYDCGNGEVESRTESNWRQPVVERVDLMDRIKHFETNQLEYDPPNNPPHPDADCMYVAMADPLLIKRLCEAIENAIPILQSVAAIRCTSEHFHEIDEAADLLREWNIES